MIVAEAGVYRFELPLHRPLPLKGTTLETRSGYLLALRDDAGVTGWGEASPLPGFSHESLAQVERKLKECATRLAGYRLPESYDELEGAGLLSIEGPSAVSFAIESAYLNLRSAQEGLPLYRYLHAAAESPIACSALLMGEGEALLESAARLATEGFDTVKLKVGRATVDEDIERVRQVSQTLGSGVTLRLDANRAWDLSEAQAFSEALDGLRIAYIEEPLAASWDLALYHQQAPIPYAVDETLHEFHRLVLGNGEGKGGALPADFPERAQRLSRILGDAAAVIWKPTLMHVPRMGEDIARRDFALPIHRLVLSSAFESGVGLNIAAQYAAAYSAPDEAAGLDTYGWLAEDVLEARLPLPHPRPNLDALDAAARCVDVSKLQPVTICQAS